VCNLDSYGLASYNFSTIASIMSHKVPSLSEELLNCNNTAVYC
jgi:hypothetical protein